MSSLVSWAMSFGERIPPAASIVFLYFADAAASSICVKDGRTQ